jgi:hypothetical protein
MKLLPFFKNMQYKKYYNKYNYILETDKYIVSPNIIISKSLISDLEPIRDIIKKNNNLRLKNGDKAIQINNKTIEDIIDKCKINCKETFNTQNIVKIKSIILENTFINPYDWIIYTYNNI